MTYSHAKVQSVSSEDRVETDGWKDRRTEGGDCVACRINAVGSDALSALTVNYVSTL